jgi:hypothetical protein
MHEKQDEGNWLAMGGVWVQQIGLIAVRLAAVRLVAVRLIAVRQTQ